MLAVPLKLDIVKPLGGLSKKNPQKSQDIEINAHILGILAT